MNPVLKVGNIIKIINPIYPFHYNKIGKIVDITQTKLGTLYFQIDIFNMPLVDGYRNNLSIFSEQDIELYQPILKTFLKEKGKKSNKITI